VGDDRPLAASFSENVAEILTFVEMVKGTEMGVKFGSHRDKMMGIMPERLFL
jgi:hypothetical protein